MLHARSGGGMPKKVGGFRALATATFAAIAGPALADTLETALVQAYQNNPQVNAQRAVVRATDENVPQALSGYRPRISATVTAGKQTSTTLSRTESGATGENVVTLHPDRRAHMAAHVWRNGDADAVQRLPDRQPYPHGGKPGIPGARNAACHRADRAARRGNRLHEFAARHRDPRFATTQRRSDPGTIAADARPLQCRRGDAH